MIVDDDAALRVTLQEILLDEGRDVISAKDGYQAIELASDGPLALILMDVQMPGMNGVDTFLKIKEILPECVVVMMTGYSAESLVQQALSEGALTVLHKPVSIEQILKILEDVVPKSSGS
ncbi:MAG: response regulator [SAR202 cluster bacterium]|nr:response regulator [SAR202 cluster bacterium]